MKSTIQINPNDNVAVALEPLKKGTTITVNNDAICLLEDIPQGHKVALCDIPEGSPVIKYGFAIGHAIQPISKGSWIHTHNCKTSLGEVLDYSYQPTKLAAAPTASDTFLGYQRNDGQVGVRNEVWIIPTVGCVNSIVKEVEKRSQHLVGDNLEGIIAFNHPYGCSQLGDDQDHTRKILADLIQHPNAGAVLVVGLGCENSNVDEIKKVLGTYDSKRVHFLVCQEYEDEIAEACKQVEELAAYAKTFTRKPTDMRFLKVGMKCGGSDGLSGITANPTVGKFSDLLIQRGGTTILTEVPEMFGAETLLMNRCKDEATFEKTVALINNFKNYFTEHHQVIYENPSPGNKKGGITTLEDKSLGCTQKSGSALVNGVMAYGDRVVEPGLNLLSAPGNDLVAATALAAAGVQIVLFTTGRGTPFASPVPTVKISSNTHLYETKTNWIDFNAGEIVTKDVPLDEMGQRLYEFVKEVASGKQVKSEIEGYHDMAIFKQGVTL